MPVLLVTRILVADDHALVRSGSTSRRRRELEVVEHP
jgi:DNA-binding NarL/FixJ family response regulator